MQNINVYAVLAKWKANKKGESPIHISIDINGKRAAFPSTKKRILPEYWDADKRQLKPQAPNAGLINSLIRKRIAEYEAEMTRKQLEGQTITKDAVKKNVGGKGYNNSFIAFCREQIDIADIQHGTLKSWNTSLNHLKAFRQEIDFRDVDFAFFQKYDAYLRKSGLSDNSIWKHFKFLRRMLLIAVKMDIIPSNPMKEYGNKKYEQKTPDYLEWDEVRQLHEAVKTKPTFTDHLRLVGYYFLLSCYSGLRYSDAIRFNYDSFVVKGNKGERLLLYAQKNKEPISMPFTPQIREVVSYIKDKPLDLSNQKFNDALKLISGLADLAKPLNSHMGRHSFAMHCAELGMSEEAVQHLLGHKDRKSTRIYFRIKNTRVDLEMEKWQ